MRPAVYIDVPKQPRLAPHQRVRRVLKAITLSPVYWALAHRRAVPGLRFHRRCVGLGLRLLLAGSSPLPRAELRRLLMAPMDSVRYFELDFAWRVLSPAKLLRYLDVSSPRLLPVLLVRHRPDARADLVNPDQHDLSITSDLVRAAGLQKNCTLHRCTIQAAPFDPESFDAVSCLSVLEHIPEDRESVVRMWELVKPGGRLVLSVPCAAEAFEEYISHNPYGLLPPRPDGYTFWQRFYDQALLQKQIFSVTGQPTRQAIYGEKVAGSYHRNMKQKMANPNYPVWREPHMMGEEYSTFDQLADLPGIGVIAFEFVKAFVRS